MPDTSPSAFKISVPVPWSDKPVEIAANFWTATILFVGGTVVLAIYIYVAKA